MKVFDDYGNTAVLCNLSDMLSVEGDADAAVEARICTGWNKFRQLVTLLHPVRTYH